MVDLRILAPTHVIPSKKNKLIKYVENIATEVNKKVEIEVFWFIFQPDTLKTENSSLRVQLEQAQNALKECEDDKKKLQAKIEELEARITQLEASITALEGKITALEGKITALKSEVTALKARITELEAQHATLTTKNQELATRVTKLETELEAAKAKAVECTPSRLTELVRQLEKLRSDLKECQRKKGKKHGHTKKELEAPDKVANDWCLSKANRYARETYGKTSVNLETSHAKEACAHASELVKKETNNKRGCHILRNNNCGPNNLTK